MTPKKPLSQFKKEMKGHREKNLKHHATVPNYLSILTEERLTRAAKSRMGYFDRLSKSSKFFADLLEDRTSIQFRTRKGSRYYVLLKKGFGETVFGVKVALLFDAKGRVIFLYKENEGAYSGQWLPFRGLARIEKEGKKEWHFITSELLKSQEEERLELSRQITLREKQIQFNKNWGIQKLNQMRKYL